MHPECRSAPQDRKAKSDRFIAERLPIPTPHLPIDILEVDVYAVGCHRQLLLDKFSQFRRETAGRDSLPEGGSVLANYIVQFLAKRAEMSLHSVEERGSVSTNWQSKIDNVRDEYPRWPPAYSNAGAYSVGLDVAQASSSCL